jgi:signal transduction histidine kinase
VPMEVLVEGVRLPGEPLAALAIARDVSERLDTQARLRRLAEAEHARAAELNAVIRAMGDGVLVCATDGSVRLANPAVRDLMHGMTPATYGALLAALDDPAAAPELGTRAGPTELRMGGDEDRWVELATYPVGILPGHSQHETIVVVRDVTDSRMSQALRETFVGVLSHELRTPITTIFGGAKILSRNGQLTDEQRQAIFTDIHVEAERLHRLVEDVIALTRFGEDGLDIGHEPVLLQRILPGIVAAEEARWPSASFTVEVVPGLPTVVADPTYVEQVVRNLLSNAAKYGGDGVRIRLVAEGDGAEVVVRILDDGPGFPSDEVDRLFELYFRSSRTATRVSGAGIGLFVCARLIRAMGGRIWAAPRPDGGAEFGFALRRMDEDGVL